ncbi:hypothetical protein EAH86_03775 [Pedococcus bigeumensis]|uniref:Glycosyltransferase RgtA/B/C/D-like domain-containing protein n=1 Tax=Pedococcus bigeumensis TaxID=433644 RepID=A0A502D318_9MICO|nr:hypothetical protein EAH86_03775 [Pedococcus bigeumensis]
MAGACVHLYLQVQMLLGLPNFSFHRFKWFVPRDQLSYLSIAVNIANGHSGSTEPFTETGVSHYPRLYYVVMGLLSRTTGVDPVVMWWLMGLTVQFLLACFVGWALYTMTRLWWAAVLAPLPFLVGTFAGVLHHTYFASTPPPGARVMWGPFALLYALNGGAAGISLAACAILGLLMVGWNGFPPRATLLAATFAAVCAGIVGNMQTYSFIGLCYVLIYATGLYGLQSASSRHRRLLTATSVLLLAAVLLSGTFLAAHVGPLPVFVLGLLPALPGYLVVCRLTSWRLLWVSLLAGVLALPTMVDTMRGLAQGDPFLVYRQASTANTNGAFGIPFGDFVLHGGVAILLVLILVLVPHAKGRLIRSVALGAFLAWALLSSNDHWGPAQEPNRFWIDEFMLVLVVCFPLLAAVAVDTVRRGWHRPRKALAAVVSVALVLWVVAAGASAKDWLIFNGEAKAKGISWWPSPRSEAIAAVVSHMPPDGMVVSDRCTDLLSLKVITGARVASYNYGLAWPDNHIEITSVLRGREFRYLDPEVLHSAGVGYLLTDSNCKMSANSKGHLRLLTSKHYAAGDRQGTLRLWEIIE